VRCSTDNLVLCQECDWDAHGSCSVSASHDRKQIEGFSGCPSALDLASLWGLDLDDKKPNQSTPSIPNWPGQDSFMPLDPSFSWMYNNNNSNNNKSSTMCLQDLIVPNDTAILGVNCGGIGTVSKKQNNPNCGKQRHVIYKQLVELFKRDFTSCGEVGGDFENDGDDHEHGLVDAATTSVAQQSAQQPQTVPFTSMLAMPATHVDLKDKDRIVNGDMLWDSVPNAHTTQIWDFNLGRLRSHEEPGTLEVAYGANDAGFMIKNFGELFKDTSLTNTKMLGDMYQMNYPITHDDMAFNVSHSDCINNLIIFSMNLFSA
jgi:hypothetical protein